ncbi:VOC family protein [Tepidiforma sp.]|uniref:VOC family protein n=1 Tax=Tepidiforma sp. TaxID=2682230 RepID=UPI002ADE680D|nr:VOC family protein [Tepidiforma sp.]
MAGIGATHIDHIVISSNNSEAVAETFARNLGIEIKRTMSRPGTGARLAFARLQEVILEFAGPPQPNLDEEVKARLWGMVLAVEDIRAAVERLRGLGYTVGDPSPAVQPGALIATVKSGTCGVPFALIQYNAIPTGEQP